MSAGGVPVRGKGGILCQVGRGLLLEIPALPSTAKNSSQFCALAMVKRGATEGAYRIRSRHSLSRNRGREEVKGARLRQEEARTVACESCKSNGAECELKREEEGKDGKGECELLQY